MKCFLFIIGLIGVTGMENTNFTFTYQMAMHCKEYICKHGYKYETYFELDSMDLKQIRKSSVELEMHLAIQASSNGHILLSEVARPAYTDPVYEIVVGGGGNKFTELRRNLKRNAKTSASTSNILSTVELRGFYIKISEDGLIEFGREGDVLPILNYQDNNPLEIRYFSFAAWSGVEAKFLYDCPVPGKTNSQDSQILEPQLSSSEDLKRTLLTERMPWNPPSPTVEVKLGVKVTDVTYDAFEAKLHTNIAVVMSWTDKSMAWNPNKFNGTTSLKVRQGEIWRPKFHAINANSIDMFDTANPDLISVVYSGEATFHFQTKITTWCAAFGKFTKWPHDDYKCAVIIQPWEAHEKILMELMDPQDLKLLMYEDIDQVVKNEWGDFSRSHNN